MQTTNDTPMDTTGGIHENRLLRVTSMLQLILAIIDLIGATAIMSGFTSATPQDLERLGRATGIVYTRSVTLTLLTATGFCTILLFLLGLFAAREGRRLLLSTHTNTHKQVANCQALAIGIIGLTLIEAILNTLLIGHISTATIIPVILWVLPPLFYYHAVGKEQRTGFWRGVKRPEIVAEDIPSLNDLKRSYRLDPEDGMLHRVPAGQDSQVDIMSLTDFLAGTEESAITQHVKDSVQSAHHCAANTYGEYLYGAILVPVEEFELTDGSYDHDICFAWLLSRDRIHFITDDPEDVLLLTRCFSRQSFKKASCAAVLYELVSYLIHHDNNYLLDLERRLDQLEDNMSTDVNEIPKDFSDYLAEMRSNLCAVEGFYKQIADMAEDIETTPAAILSKEVRELYSSLDNKASRLASDTHLLREYVLQIRSIYQEKINVRQNNVISVLTIVTAIFMPLTLLTGWYGMNFENMPELHQPYAYFLLMILAVTIVTSEICFFKEKRWF